MASVAEISTWETFLTGPYVFNGPQLKPNYGHLLVGSELPAHEILFFGKMVSGAEQDFHMLLGKMYMSGGYAYGNHKPVSGRFLLHGFHYQSGNQFNLIRLHSHTHFSSDYRIILPWAKSSLHQCEVWGLHG